MRWRGGAGRLEKGGLAAALRAVGGTAEGRIGWADELRVGLVSAVRRVWAPRGVKVRQVVQFRREWCYLNLAVDVRAGRLWWCWTESMRGAELASVVGGW